MGNRFRDRRPLPRSGHALLWGTHGPDSCGFSSLLSAIFRKVYSRHSELTHDLPTMANSRHLFWSSTGEFVIAATIIPVAVSRQKKMADGASVGKIHRSYWTVIFRSESSPRRASNLVLRSVFDIQ